MPLLSLTPSPPLPFLPAPPLPDYEDLDAADDEELKANAVAPQDASHYYCCKPKNIKTSKKHIDLEGVPVVPLFEYPDTIADVQENYKKQA